MAAPYEDTSIIQDPTAWLAVSFVIFMFILVKMGKGAFLKLLDSRIEGIREEIETAENLRVEAQDLLAQYQRKHRDAVKESEQIIADAESRADEILKAADAELGEITKRREKQLKDRLERLEQSAINEIQAYAADLAIKATTEIIAEQLDKKANAKLVDDSIKSLPGNIH